MTAVTYLTRHRRPGIVILCSIVAVLSMLFVLPPAIASAADSGAQAVDECNPTASNGCVNGILQDADKKPIADVTITLSGKATAETKTAADGKWAFSVADDGDYTVTIDASVAKEHGLKASSATVTIRKASFDKQRGVVRFDQAGDSTGSGTSGTSGSSGSANGTKGATGTSGSTAATQSPVKKGGSNVGKRIWQQLYSGIIFGLMLGLMSVGMNLVYGTTGLQSFSHGEQVTLGGLMAYVGTQMLHMPLIASAIFAIVIGALTGFIQNEIVWGPLRRRHVGTMQQMIVTIGLSMALQYTFQFFFGGDIKGIVKSVPDSFQLGPITTDMPTLVSALIAICVIVGVTLFLYKTRLGRATRAVSDNAALAAASGINVDQVVRVVWILSCAMAALSGVLLGVYLNGISWNTGATLILLMFAAVTLGGLGTANGALIGSLVIGIVADMSSLVIPNDMRYASALANPHHRSAGAPAGHLRQAAKGGLIHGHHDNHLQRGGRADRPTTAAYVLAAIGLNIHFGMTGLMNMGQAGFMLLGAYGFAITQSMGCNLFASVCAALALAVIYALLLGIPTLKLGPDYLAMVTLAAAEIIRIIGRSTAMTNFTGGSAGISPQDFTEKFESLSPLPDGSTTFLLWTYSNNIANSWWLRIVAWVLVVIAALLCWRWFHSPWGRMLKGIREDENAIRSLGKPVTRYKMESLILGGLFGAIAGIIFVLPRSVQPDSLGRTVTFYVWTILLLGGAATILGPVLGSCVLWVLLTFVKEVMRNTVPETLISSNQIEALGWVIVGVALMCLVIFRPQGLLGDRKELAFHA